MLTPADAPFDFYLDGWDESAAQLQASGDLLLVRLPFGFLGGLVIRGRDVWMEVIRTPAAPLSRSTGTDKVTCS